MIRAPKGPRGWIATAKHHPPTVARQGAAIALEEAVANLEFVDVPKRGNVRGAMDTTCHCGKVREEWVHCEQKKYNGNLPLIGANTYLPTDHGGEITTSNELIH